ncbi:phytanoyl-CoA dioxygenase family protein [Candidatus Poribacteria bacterium]|nr:phytanoyl-CoA dioxygenase family protein [Candidatus Poribacteria bacterium]MBT5714819.1 phytanoyl-CoA dioxygenase family protein [Candidatus Poribacteria bacterium]MBT7100820.1 phytanoyl-CoA dioxygenase family protein [Candidatus Poribacteria bacterium]MBT7806319.1 phytanoyl-CoA dioxygenase family protein [Candidatus Poribacteria bacterium]
MSLTPEERSFYADNGYLVRREIVDAGWLDEIRREVDDLHGRMAEAPVEGVGISWEEYDDTSKPARIRQLMHGELVSAGLDRLIDSPNVLDVLRPLMGDDISLFHCKLLMKAAHDGTITPWHQDYAYWTRHNNEPQMINCMLHMDDADAGNGAIQFVPGSHRDGLLEHDRADMSFGVFLPGYFGEREGAVTLDMRAGDAVFFGPLVIHGSDANTSERDRRACTMAYDVTGNGYCRRVVSGTKTADRTF